MIEEDAPRPRPNDRPTTVDRAADSDDEYDNDVPEAVTTKKPAATVSLHEPTSKLAQIFAEYPKTPELDLGGAKICSNLKAGDDADLPVPVAREFVEQPALLTQALAAPAFEDDGVPVSPAARGGTLPVSLVDGNMSRAAVSLVSGASWLSGCGHDRLAALITGMSNCLRGSPSITGAEVLEYIGSKLVVDLLRAGTPFTGEQIGTILVQAARDVGVDPCSRTMRKIAKDNDAKALKYEELAAQAEARGDMIGKAQWLTRADERRSHARDLRKATR